MILGLTADWHETPFAEKKFETQKKNIGEIIIQWAGRLLGRSSSQKVMDEMREIIKIFDITTVIHNGDLQENSRNEQGIVTDEDLESAKSIVDRFEKTHRVKMLLNAGNHELGYDVTAQPLASDPEGGITLTSVINFLKLVDRNELYHSFRIGGYRIAFVPYLLTEQFVDLELIKEKRRIIELFMYDLQQGEKMILFLHDPDSLTSPRLTELIREYKSGIPLIFCGHYHAQLTLAAVNWLIRICNWKILTPVRWLLRIGCNILFDKEKSKGVQEAYRQRKLVPTLMSEFGVKIVPAPGGMLGFGGGFLTLDLDTLEVTKY